MRIVAIIVNLSLVFLMGTVFLFIVGRIPPSGALGFRPIDDGCYGISFENEEVYEKVPKGKVRISFFNLEYYVPAKKENKSPRGFCLGKNFWDKKNWEKQQQLETDSK